MTKEDASGKSTAYFKRKRDPKTGKFDDAQLVADMTQVIKDPIYVRFPCSRICFSSSLLIGQFGAQNVPKIFKSIEILYPSKLRRIESISGYR